jgi:hypothetical protein
MHPFTSTTSARSNDEWVFGWDPTPGIISVWAGRDGRAVMWRREDDRVLRVQETFRPWLFATTLDDLTHLGSALVSSSVALSVDTALISYRTVAKRENYPTMPRSMTSYCYLLM